MRVEIQPVSYNYAGAAIATGISVDVIRRAVRAGDLAAHHPIADGRPVSRPLILAEDLHAWVAAGPAAYR